jgi:diphosphomevalonate decarboxylase
MFILVWIMQLFTDRSLEAERLNILGTVTYSAPSNIALVKYWGKKGRQLPQNPSLSLTLETSRTTTTLEFQGRTYLRDNKKGPGLEFFFHGEQRPDFHTKISTYLDSLALNELPYLKYFDFVIRTENSFPHSSGIASSASSMAALAGCLAEIHFTLHPELKTYELYPGQLASILARLGSGSAARSVAGPFMQWGLDEEAFGHDHYAVLNKNIHSSFTEIQDSILIISAEQKSVASTAGHRLMEGHPFSEARFLNAKKRLMKLKSILSSGDWDGFIELVEVEALELHALMMCSNPSYLLMKPQTLEAIYRIRAYRQAHGLPMAFTLDAGANLHLLYPGSSSLLVHQFIDQELRALCENGQVLHDYVGRGLRREGAHLS